MQYINLDSENTTFDAVIKTYGTMDLLLKLIIENGGELDSLPQKIVFDDLLSESLKNNYVVTKNLNITPNVVFKRSWLQTDFDMVLNVCVNLDNLVNILSENGASLGNAKEEFSIQKIYIADSKVSKLISGLNKRFNTGFNIKATNFLLQENGFYLLQENKYKIIL